MRTMAALVSVLVSVLAVGSGMAAAPAQSHKVDIEELLKETQKGSPGSNEMTIVWWVPEQFWRASMAEDPGLTEAGITEFIEVLSPYTLFIVVDGRLGPVGGVTYTSETELRARIELRDHDGTAYALVPAAKVTPDAENLLDMLKPVLANMLGPMGENMHMVLFPSKKADGRLICDPKGEDSFTVALGEREFKWRLPLGSLLPKKICPTCGDELNGAYSYCPWDGTKLPQTD
jgi:hypothetical protein